MLRRKYTPEWIRLLDAIPEAMRATGTWTPDAAWLALLARHLPPVRRSTPEQELRAWAAGRGLDVSEDMAVTDPAWVPPPPTPPVGVQGRLEF